MFLENALVKKFLNRLYVDGRLASEVSARRGSLLAAVNPGKPDDEGLVRRFKTEEACAPDEIGGVFMVF